MMGILPELAVLLGFSAIAIRFKSVTMPGVVTGISLGLVFAVAPTPAPFWAFVVFVLFGLWSSRLGIEKKRKLAMLADAGERRSAIHALANAGPAALILGAGLLVGEVEYLEAASVAACAALAAMLSDTVASEWGIWMGKSPPRNILTFKPVPVGTDGGVTLVGMVCAMLAAMFIAGLTTLLSDGSTRAFWAVVAGGFSGNLADSVLGASLEHLLGRYGNAIVNSLASVVGGVVGWLLVI